MNVKSIFLTCVGIAMICMLFTIGVDFYLNRFSTETVFEMSVFIALAVAWKTGNLVKLVSDE